MGQETARESAQRKFTLSSIRKSYGGREVLSDVSLEVAPAETIAIVGPSGCGKSTLLRVLTGMVTPDSGLVKFDGEEVTPESGERLRREVGFVVQGGGLFPHLTAHDNIAILAQTLRWEMPRVRGRIEQLLALTRLPGDALSRYPAQLSGGQRQRVALMRALMLDPAVLLLDEPLGALDPITRFDMQQELRETFRVLGKTVVFVTHDLAEAAFLSARLVLMRAGQIEQEGTIETLRDAPATPFVARFIGAHRSLETRPS